MDISAQLQRASAADEATSIRVAALTALTQLANDERTDLSPHADVIVAASLACTASDVAVELQHAAVSFLLAASDGLLSILRRSDQDAVKTALLDAMAAGMREARQPTVQAQWLSLAAALLESSATYLSCFTVAVSTHMLSLLEVTTPEAVAMAALEWWIALAQHESKMKSAARARGVVAAAAPVLLDKLSFLLSTTDGNVGATDKYTVDMAAANAVEGIGKCLESAAWQIVGPWVAVRATSVNWKERDASIMLIGTLVAHVGEAAQADIVSDLLPSLLAKATPGTSLRDPEECVRHSALWCVGEIIDACTILEPSVVGAALAVMAQAIEADVVNVWEPAAHGISRIANRMQMDDELPATAALSSRMSDVVRILLAAMYTTNPDRVPAPPHIQMLAGAIGAAVPVLNSADDALYVYGAVMRHLQADLDAASAGALTLSTEARLAGLFAVIAECYIQLPDGSCDDGVLIALVMRSVALADAVTEDAARLVVCLRDTPVDCVADAVQVLLARSMTCTSQPLQAALLLAIGALMSREQAAEIVRRHGGAVLNHILSVIASEGKVSNLMGDAIGALADVMTNMDAGIVLDVLPRVAMELYRAHTVALAAVEKAGDDEEAAEEGQGVQKSLLQAWTNVFQILSPSRGDPRISTLLAEREAQLSSLLPSLVAAAKEIATQELTRQRQGMPFHESVASAVAAMLIDLGSAIGAASLRRLTAESSSSTGQAPNWLTELIAAVRIQEEEDGIAPAGVARQLRLLLGARR